MGFVDLHVHSTASDGSCPPEAVISLAVQAGLDAIALTDHDTVDGIPAAQDAADAAGIRGMVGGQTIDLQYEHRQADLAVLEQLQDGKTAALMIAACEMGARLGGGSPEQIEAARRFGRETGLCFQIVDDILDVTSSAQTLGKPTGGDAALAKNTYVSLLGLEGARRLAGQRTREALAALEVFGDAAQELRGLAAALLERKK